MSARPMGGTAAAMNAERIKLSTVRSPRWSCLGAAVVSLGIAAIQGATAGGFGVPPEEAVAGVAVIGVPVLTVLAALTVTGEYRSGMITTTFLATPSRATVLAAKAAVAAAFSAVFVAVLSVAAMLVAEASDLADVGAWRVVGAMACYAALAAVLGVAVGALLRHSAGAVTLLLLWPLLLEPLIGYLPRVGAHVRPYLPYGNILAFTGVQRSMEEMPWGRIGSLVYVAVVFGAVFVAATVVVERRDA